MRLPPSCSAQFVAVVMVGSGCRNGHARVMSHTKIRTKRNSR
jgi:hypothetical protein